MAMKPSCKLLAARLRSANSILSGSMAFPLLLLSAGLLLVQPCAGACFPAFENTGSLNTARFLHTATLLPNGMVLVAGGRGPVGFEVTASAELYDPASGSWTVTGSLNTARFLQTATLLPSDKVLVAGGVGGGVILASAELYDPANGTWTTTSSLNTARAEPTATLLLNGMVLVAGGIADGLPLASAELYITNTAPTITAATGVTRQQGAASSNSQIATVNDNEDQPTALTVTVDGGTSATVNGVTVSNIVVDSSGNVTADVVASCSASDANFTLRVTDPCGLYDEDALTIGVTPSDAPVITLRAPAVLQPNVNHSYRTFTITQMVQSAMDDCDGNVISSVVIEKATSDEVEDGLGDGHTLNDIVIASDCKSVQLRAERDGTKDGRVYLVTLRVSDTSDNVSRAVYKVSVPKGIQPAIDSGVHYTVLSNCQL
jgi:Galactose oxidase, central domain/Kelch motif